MARSGARVLIVGSGGREHALGVALAGSPEVGALLYAGGPNAGLERIAERLPAVPEDGGFDLVVIGPEAPLVDGLADRLRDRGVAVFGPGREAARLEASKAFTKRLALEAGIPTANAAVCDTLAEAEAALHAMGAPMVVKADGLAAGKGVTVAETAAEALRAVRDCFAGAFGAAGARVVLEERLAGPEVSLFALSDGTSVRALGTARDYKRAFDGDAGPNTGGMGAVSPAPGFSAEAEREAMGRIVVPALAALGVPYVGVLYAGLMLTTDGPKLIEFNVRFGDPEAQVLLPRFRADPFAVLHGTATGRLAERDVALRPETAVGVVLAARDYPAGAARGEPIGGLEGVEAAGVRVLHAATRAEGGRVLAEGGRVLTAVALGADAAEARARVYEALRHLSWPGGRMRTDIGL